MQYMKLISLFFSVFFGLISTAIADNNNTVTASPVLTRGEATQDMIIKTKLQVAYNLNPELRRFNITTRVDQGIVTLKGTLQNDIQKDLAIAIAQDVEGVQSITDHLTVDKNTKAGENPSDFGQKVTDATITAITKSRLLLNPHLNQRRIQVTTVNNITTLSGSVKTLKEKSIAGRLAVETPGVSSVKNELSIKP